MQTEITNEIGLIPLQADTSLLKAHKKFTNGDLRHLQVIKCPAVY